MKLGLAAFACGAVLHRYRRCILGDQRNAPRRRPGLHAFLLRANEPVAGRSHLFADAGVRLDRAVRGADHYDCQLATSRASSLVDAASYDELRHSPCRSRSPHPASVDDRQAHALWAHVRGVANGKTSRLEHSRSGSTCAGARFPQQVPAPEGLVRWTPSTARRAIRSGTPTPGHYNVHSRRSRTSPTSASTGRSTPPTPRPIHWRVRAIRFIDARTCLQNGLRARATGRGARCSPRSTRRRLAARRCRPRTDLGHLDKAGSPPRHTSSTPGFAWTEHRGAGDVGSVGSSLYRVYIFTDKQCVNAGVRPARSSARPAFAPRTVGGTFAPAAGHEVPRLLGPGRRTSMTKGTTPHAFDATGAPVVSNELPGGQRSARSRRGPGRRFGPVRSVGRRRRRSSSAASRASISATTAGRGPVLLDGRARRRPLVTTSAPIQRPRRPHRVPRPRAPAGRMRSRAGHGLRQSQSPPSPSPRHAVGSGLVASMRVVASAAKVPGRPRPATRRWQPAIGATTYEIQLSRQLYPWKAVGSEDRGRTRSS